MSLGRPIRLWALAPTLGAGGAERHMLRVLNRLDPQDYQISLYAARAGGAYEPEIAAHIGYRPVVSDNRASSLLSAARLGQRLRRDLRAGPPPDLLFAQLIHICLAARWALSGLRQRPLQVVGVANPPYHEVERLFRALMRLGIVRGTFARADHLVALSSGVAQELRRLAPEAERRISIIHNACVDEDGAHAAVQPDAGGGPQTVLACGRLGPQKNYSVLLRAFARVLAQGIDARLDILGEGSLRAELFALAGRLGISGQVRFLGFQPAVGRHMAAATVLALTSDYEGFGNVIVEAMACGTPVVATDCPYGPGEILAGGGGLLAPVGSVNGVAEALRRVLTDTDLRERLSVEARRRAQDFSAGAISAQFDALFRRLVAEKRA